MVDNSYQLCPSGSIFPSLYGINGRVGDFQPTECSTELWGSDQTLDGQYLVFGGFMEWDGKDFLPQDDFEVVLCEGVGCSEQPDYNTTGIFRQRGIIHLYNSQNFEQRKYYILSASNKIISVNDVAFLQVSQNDSAVTSAASNWGLSLTSNQQVVALGAAIITYGITEIPRQFEFYYFLEFAVVQDLDFEDIQLMWRSKVRLDQYLTA